MTHTFPKQLETERLILRVATEADAVEINTAAKETLPMLQPYLPWAYPAPTVEDTQKYIQHCQERAKKGTYWNTFIYDKATGEFIGGCGFHDDITPATADIGYWCKKSAQGNGYITEAVNALTNFAFESLNLKRITIQYIKENTESMAVAKRLGFKVESQAPYAEYIPFTKKAHTLVTTVKFHPNLKK